MVKTIFSTHTFRLGLLLLFVVVLLGMLVIKLFQLQIIEGSYFRDLSNGNRIKTTLVHSPRGIIFDRNGANLVYNLPGFRRTENNKTILLSYDEAVKEIAKGRKDLAIDSLRQYPHKEAFAHVLGYISQITKEELETEEFSLYKGGDLIGKMGIERQYEKKLAGEDGKKLVEVDAMGKEIRVLGEEDATAGEDIMLTLDAKLQNAAYEALKDTKKGAVIVSTPDGEILALISKPSFDPNLFTMGKGYKVATDAAYANAPTVVSDGSNQPLLNRAIAGAYPPGSTFKLVTAASALEGKLIDENYSVSDTGILRVGEFSFANWYFTQYGRTDGNVNVVKGIKRSNDIFFYKLAELVGVDRLSEMARRFGLGNELDIDLAGEAPGIVPDPKWKKDAIGEGWYLGDTYHYGIGQGFLLTTPLQVNSWTATVANGGTVYEPRLVKNQKSKIKNQKFLSEKTVSLIRQGMIESCQPGGVAWPLFKLKIKNPPAGRAGEKLKIDGRNFLEVRENSESAVLKDQRELVVACKTGTAEHGGKDDLPHAWITLFAPAYDPEIVVTVLSESSGEGSNIAAPIAKKILEEWFSR